MKKTANKWVQDINKLFVGKELQRALKYMKKEAGVMAH